MDKYVNAEDFKRKLIDEKKFFPAIVKRALEEMPAANVREFKQGKWVEHAHYNHEGSYSGSEYECPFCHYTTTDLEDVLYCFHCGAELESE